MARASFFDTVYHRKDWTLADAFRPQPGWGSRRFTVPADKLGALTDDELLAGAQEAAPEGYRLTELSHYPADGPKRVIWSTPADARFGAKQPAAPAAPFNPLDHEQTK